MFLLMSVGFLIYKKKMIDDHSTKQLTDIVLYIVNPALSLVSFQQSFSADKLIGFMIVFVLSFVTIFLGIFVGKIVIGKDFRLEQYACGFSNAGFIGIPLVQNLLGVEYVCHIWHDYLCFTNTTSSGNFQYFKYYRQYEYTAWNDNSWNLYR